jgi:hypothetical protein
VIIWEGWHAAMGEGIWAQDSKWARDSTGP